MGEDQCRGRPYHERIQYRLKASLVDRPAMTPGTAVHVGTVTISAGATTKVTGLTTVNSIEILPHSGDLTRIEITETAKPPASAQARPLTGLIGIQGLAALAEAPIEVRVNVSVPKDHFAMGFIFDRDTGRFEGMPLKELAGDHVTVVSRHFCEFLILSLPFGELPAEEDSGFRPGIDDWEFANNGSYLAPGGHCAGQAISAMYYYVNDRLKGQPPLFRMWDNPGNDWATPDVGTDNQRGCALASLAQKAIDWGSFANQFGASFSPGDLNTYRCFVLALWVTGEPQEPGLYREGGGHDIIAWKCAYGTIHVADPNYPGSDTRWINLNSTRNRFDPYDSGPTAADLGVAYPEIRYAGKTATLDWNEIGRLWEQARAGTIGAGVFPLTTIKIFNEDGSIAALVTNSMKGGIITIPITGAKFMWHGNWDSSITYRPDGSKVDGENGWITAEGETNTFGIELYKNYRDGTNIGPAWVGFQWFNLL